MLTHEIDVQPGFLQPKDICGLAARGNDRVLIPRPHNKLEALRKGLGLPEPAHNRLAAEFHQVVWSYSGHPFEYAGHRQPLKLRDNAQFGSGCFVLGWHSERYDDRTQRFLPDGPVELQRRRNQKDWETPADRTNKLPVLNVKLIPWSQHTRPLRGWEYSNPVGVQVDLEGEPVWVYAGMDVAEAVFDLHVNNNGNLELDGREFGPFPSLISFDRFAARTFDFLIEDIAGMRYDLHIKERSLNNLLHTLAKNNHFTPTTVLKKPGLTKLYNNVLQPLAEELFASREYLCWMALRSLLTKGGNTVSKVKISTVLNHEFANISSVDELKAKLVPFTKLEYGAFYSAFESLTFFKEKRKEIVKNDNTKAFRKRVAEVEEIEIEPEKYPLTHAALEDGSIPLGCVFPSGETYFLINDNWDLWEEMLTKFPEKTKEIAQKAARRAQYERDVMSYFYFLLYALPEYLNRHTGYKWTCSPRLVESQYELEPDEVEEDRGVVKRRSALTPVADNQKHHVVVPYCSMQVYGQRTTYCYAHNYHLLERGMVFDGNVVTRDLEEKLNGKDDYGLMFYTLTGSASNRGYPTFLIIFERLKRKNKTRVHFHRVHPMRSKDGDRNPISNWTKVSYKWMIGNVATEDVEFQQGDLAFLRVPEDKVDFSEATEVTDCDSHCFAQPVKFVPYTGKSKHILGHVRIDTKGVKLCHPEHDDVATKTGVFQVRQCRSWEANPKGVWTLNFD